MIDNQLPQFFSELKDNNNRDWFHENKKRYEKHVKKPFAALVADLLIAFQDQLGIGLEPKDCIFRINRDIRFSKDKSPYKLNTSAVFAPGGKKDHSRPGLYVELGAEKMSIAGGSWMPDKEQLHKIRTYIASDTEKYNEVFSEKGFVSYFGEVKGDENKRLPKEFQEAGEICPDIYKKQFYWWADIPIHDAIGKGLKETILEYRDNQTMQSMYMTEAMEGN
ncbi:MAG: hypothetical protein Kapaf2KO_16860 [Candidatus Kapaibacteriales bacterium]